MNGQRTTQNNLGLALSERIRGKKSHNLEQAIYYYNQALQQYTRSRFPYDWAKTQNYLGILPGYPFAICVASSQRLIALCKVLSFFSVCIKPPCIFTNQ
ncbi:hypothetical protein [Brasilonema bromeliae]|uniref:hypothetical protein n=1 Tax=Brasilonema bromeliae TaxID=383615 RepID=UPI00145E7BEC|nr:hypothetical protein [Brasilonema bromeliae]